jgi:hypothetical protein
MVQPFHDLIECVVDSLMELKRRSWRLEPKRVASESYYNGDTDGGMTGWCWLSRRQCWTDHQGPK